MVSIGGYLNIVCVALALVLAGSSSAAAQAPQSMFGQRGPLNNRGLRNFSGGRFGGSAGGLGLSGGQATAGGAAGALLPVPPGAAAAAGFLGGGVGERFIGAPPALAEGTELGPALSDPLGGRNGSGTTTARPDAGDGANEQLNPPTPGMVRARRMIGFEYVRPTEDVLTSRIEQRLDALRQTNPFLNEVELRIGTDGSVILQGTVPSARDKRIAEHLVGFEPGVREVRNQLQVADSSH